MRLIPRAPEEKLVEVLPSDSNNFAPALPKQLQLWVSTDLTPAAEAAENEEVDKAEGDNYFETLLQKGTFPEAEEPGLLNMTKIHAVWRKEPSAVAKKLCSRCKLTNCHCRRSG